jgi:hypothetical protein
MGRGRISGQYCLQTFQVACARRGFPASSVRSNRWRFRPIRSSQCEPQPIIFLPNVPRSANVTTRDPSRSSIHVRESIERRSDVQSPFEAVRWSSGAGTETVATHEAMLYQGRTISALRLQNVVNVLNGRKKLLYATPVRAGNQRIAAPSPDVSNERALIVQRQLIGE